MKNDAAMTIRDAFSFGFAMLRRHRCAGSVGARETEELLAFVLGKNREFLLAHPETALTAPQLRQYRALLRRRMAHEPIEHLLGRASFYGRTFSASRRTLIPRAATELLIDAALADIGFADQATVVDVGTGSGAVAVTIALERPASRVVATDVSTAALAVARTNARRHGVSTRVTFLKTDLLPRSSKLSPFGFQLPVFLIANLPYIPTKKISSLPRDVREFEPRIALDGGKDGLVPYRALLERISALDVPIRLYCEILPSQYRPLAAVARRTLRGCDVAEIRSGVVRIGARITWQQIQ